MPVDVFRGEGSQRQKLTLPGNLQDPGDTGQGLEDWLARCSSRGCTAATPGQVTEMTTNGIPRRVSWFHPDDVWRR